GWVLSVAHFALVNEHALDALPPRDIRPVEDLPRLDYDHSAMIERALLALRKQYLDTPDPWRILEHFTLGELRAFHERIDPGTHLRDTFRRVMEPQLIEVVDAPRTSGWSKTCNCSMRSTVIPSLLVSPRRMACSRVSPSCTNVPGNRGSVPELVSRATQSRSR
ncbi:hypothetical protein EBZ80_28285, partial [bacterium]|nr:hypothetical protein [bacterium]